MKRLTSALAGIVAILALVVLTGCGESSNAPPPPPVKYSLKLYGDSTEPLRTFIGTRATAGEGIAYVITEGDNEYTRAVGTWVLEPEGALPAAERAADSKYKVVLYNGSTVLRTWYTSYATAGEGIVFIKTAEGVDYTRASGTITLEVLK